MDRIQINNFDELSNDFILNIHNNLFQLTQANRTFLSKNTFITKIHDKRLRYKMLQEILII